MSKNEGELEQTKSSSNLYININRKSFKFEASDLTQKENLLITDFVLKKASINTQKSYKSALKHFFSFFQDKTLKEITFSDVAKYNKEKLSEFKNSTRKTKLTKIKSLFTYLKKVKYIEDNPLEEIKYPRVDEVEILTKTPTVEDIKRVIEVSDRERDKLLIEFLYRTGLRVSEALSLKFYQFTKNKKDKNLVIFNVKGKGDKTRFGVISLEFYERLKSGLNGVDEFDENLYLFRREKGSSQEAISRFYVSRLLKDLSIKAKLKNPIWPHGLRHAHATHALEKGASLSAIQKTLGHESIKTTGKYLSTDLENQSGKFLKI